MITSDEPKRLLALASGDSTIGMGQISRLRTLALAVTELGYPIEVILISEPHLLSAFEWPGIDVTSVVNLAEAESEIQFRASQQKLEMLITDLPGLDSATSAWARCLGVEHLVHLCDSGIDDYEATLFVNGDLLPPAPRGRAGLSELLGPQYHLVRPEVVARRPTVLELPDAPQRVLISLGGADPAGLTEEIADAFSGTSYQTTFVFGPATDRRRSERLAARVPEAAVLHTPSDLPSLILGNDLLISLPGLTSYEAMCLGTPVVSVAWNKLGKYARAIAEAGCGEVLRCPFDAQDVMTTVVRSGIASRAKAEAAFSRIDGYGAYRVASYLISLITS